MPPGWAEFSAWMQQHSTAGTLDAEAAWSNFRQVAGTSEQAGVADLAERFAAAPEGDRLALAGTIAGLLAPVEWPASWRAPRQKLVLALEGLVRETAPGSLPFDLTVDEQALDRAGWTDLSLAQEMLRLPCRRDEIRMVARLCEGAHFTRWRVLGRALGRLGERAAEEPALSARRHYAVVFRVYADAARALNEASGAVMFSGLDFGLDYDDQAT